MVVKPTQKDLIRGEPQQILDCLALFAEAIQFGVKFYVDLAEQPASDNLPDETEDQMLSALLDVLRTDVNHRAPDGLGGRDNDVVVLSHLEGINLFAWSGLVQNSHIDRIRDRIIDEFTKDQPVATLVEQLHGVRGDWNPVADVRIAFKHGVDMIRKLGAFVLVDCMADVRVRTLDSDLACLGREATGGGLHFGVELWTTREYSTGHHITRWMLPRPNPQVRLYHLHQH